jgi:hypothetical protein
MSTDARTQALASLLQLSELAPALRIGQLAAHLGEMSEDDGGHGLGDIEDDRLLEMIRRHRQELSQAEKQSRQRTGAASLE